jgi:hypothetical protein
VRGPQAVEVERQPVALLSHDLGHVFSLGYNDHFLLCFFH